MILVMPVTSPTPPSVDTAKAQEIWAEYQRQHDLSGQLGRTAGIDPVTGKVWIGDSIFDVVDQRDADGSDAPLLFERIGHSAYFRKGGRR